MYSKHKFSFIFILFIFLSTSLSVKGLGEDQDNPATAQLGDNTGTITTNTAGGRYYFNFSTIADKSYNLELVGADNTKFDVYLFDSSNLPALIVEDSKEFSDEYPVIVDNFRTENDWVLIQVYSNPSDGGLGDFTLTIIDNATVSNNGSAPIVAIFPIFQVLAILTLLRKSTSKQKE